MSYRIERGAISADVEIPPSSAEIWLQILLNYEIALEKLQDMSNNLENMNNTLDALDQRFIDAGVENKANISLDNLNTAGINKLLTEVNLDTIKGGTTYKKYYIQGGTVSVVKGVNPQITFPKAFKEPPIVSLNSTWNSYGATLKYIAQSWDLTETGFTMYISGEISPSWNGTVQCIAFAELGEG